MNLTADDDAVAAVTVTEEPTVPFADGVQIVMEGAADCGAHCAKSAQGNTTKQHNRNRTPRK